MQIQGHFNPVLFPSMRYNKKQMIGMSKSGEYK